ncbi:hypothetical protein INT44_004239, partial [Umbelopsis vinacea]
FLKWYVANLHITILSAATNVPQSSVPVVTSAPSATSSNAVIATSNGASGSATSINTAPQSTAGAAPSASSAAASGNSLQNLPISATFPASMQPAYLTWSTPTPNQSQPPLYKIYPNTNVTMVWGFGPNLKVRPQNLTLAAIDIGKNTQTISILDGLATSAIWHLSDVPQATPLMNGVYKIVVMDQRGPTPYPSPGWYYPGATLTIAMYSPQAYVSYTDTAHCPTCLNSSSAFSLHGGLKPWLVALGIATMSSVVFLYSIV